MITSSNSLCRERDAQSSSRCSTSHHVRLRAVPRTNRTSLTANICSQFAHPIQLNRQPASHRYLGNTLVSTHRQMDVPTSPVRMDSRCCLGRLHQQKTQQGTALFANVPQLLLATTGVLARNHSHVGADLLATRKPTRS